MSVNQFLDPNNLKTVMTVEMASRKEGVNGTLVLPKNYPRFVLCAKDPNKNASAFENITVRYRMKGALVFNEKLPPLRPTFLESDSDRYVPLRGFGMCTKLPIDSTNVQIFWKNSHVELLLFFSVHEDEPFYKQTKSDGAWITLEVSPSIHKIIIGISRIDFFRFYLGRGSPFSNRYPSDLIPYDQVYHRNHCKDLYYLEKIKKAGHELDCIDKYERFLKMLTDEKGPWDISKIGCKWTQHKTIFQFHLVDCGCDLKNMTQQLPIQEPSQRYCPWNSFHVEYVFTNQTFKTPPCSMIDKDTSETKNENSRVSNAEGKRKNVGGKNNGKNGGIQSEKKGGKEDSSDIQVGQEKNLGRKNGEQKCRNRERMFITLKPQPIKMVTTTESHAMQLHDLFAQIGGFLGLLVGASVITLFEFAEYFTLGVFQRVKSTCNRIRSNGVTVLKGDEVTEVVS